MLRKMALVAGLAAVAACAGGDNETAVADSLNRDLQMAPVDSSVTLNDRPADSAAPANTSSTTRTPTTSRPTTSRPATSSNTNTSTSTPSSSSTAGRSLAAGTNFGASTLTEISSRTHKVGQTITARISQNVRDGAGRIVIPAGSEVTLRITAIHESENKSDNTGTLTLAATSVSINGTSYGIDGSVSGLNTKLVDRATNAGDVAKVGAGAAAGAVVGRVLGGNTKGAVIGGVIGGAVGAQRANETQDRDVVLASGSDVTITLNSDFSAS